jgi:hypothetical protein
LASFISQLTLSGIPLPFSGEKSDPVDKLLLEKIPTPGILRVAGIYNPDCKNNITKKGRLTIQCDEM